jgi:hypothetical protein
MDEKRLTEGEWPGQAGLSSFVIRHSSFVHIIWFRGTIPQ